jgi:hypothetical protein
LRLAELALPEASLVTLRDGVVASKIDGKVMVRELTAGQADRPQASWRTGQDS